MQSYQKSLCRNAAGTAGALACNAGSSGVTMFGIFQLDNFVTFVNILKAGRLQARAPRFPALAPAFPAKYVKKRENFIETLPLILL